MKPLDLSDSLASISPRDKPWDVHKRQANQVKEHYSCVDYHRYAERMAACANFLQYALEATDPTEFALRLIDANFCRCRHCPICQWRRSLMWVARFLEALPKIQADFPQARYIFLTLTVQNCPVGELRARVEEMTAAWQRLSQRKAFPMIGYARATEVTRNQQDGSAHPHFHILGMVEPKYFQGAYYLSQARWSELWKKCLRVDYTPVVHVRAVKPNPKRSTGDPDSAIAAAIAETFKYSVKPGDLVKDQEWLLAITEQLHKTRAVSLGGFFRTYLSDSEPFDLIGSLEEREELLSGAKLMFRFDEKAQHYMKVNR